MTDIRADIPDKYKWDLSAIYENEELFYDDIKKAEQMIEDFAAHEKKMLSSANDLYLCLVDYHDTDRVLTKLYEYAARNFDLDISNNKYQAMTQRVLDLYKKFGAVSYFVTPAIISLDPSTLDAWFSDHQDLSKFRREIEREFRYKPHTLSEEGERIVSQMQKCLGSHDDIYSIFKNSDMTHGKIKDEEGKMVELSDANYVAYLMSEDRSVRRRAFKTMYKSYETFKNTFATVFGAHVKEKTTLASLRSYADSLTASTFYDEVTPEIYKNLIDTVSKNLDPLFKYYKMKGKALGLSRVHMYDLYVPLVSECEREYSYEEAVEEVLSSLSVLGDEYVNILSDGIKNKGWIDVYPSKAKRSGAYSAGCYDTQPYILLNYMGKFDDVSTLAHEAGHSMHSYYSRTSNAPHESEYTIFVAEVASTVNELLLSYKRLRESKSDFEKMAVLNHLMETYKGTLYRQTMFAEFEMMMHSEVERGTPLTAEFISAKYYDTVKKYFSNSVVCDHEISYEWMRIPHFYYNFYVYKYATCISAASAIVRKIESGGEKYIKKYIKFLSAGGSMSPIESLLICDIDLREPSVIDDAISIFSETVEAFDSLYNKNK